MHQLFFGLYYPKILNIGVSGFQKSMSWINKHMVSFVFLWWISCGTKSQLNWSHEEQRAEWCLFAEAFLGALPKGLLKAPGEVGQETRFGFQLLFLVARVLKLDSPGMACASSSWSGQEEGSLHSPAKSFSGSVTLILTNSEVRAVQLFTRNNESCDKGQKTRCGECSI